MASCLYRCTSAEHMVCRSRQLVTIFLCPLRRHPGPSTGSKSRSSGLNLPSGGAIQVPNTMLLCCLHDALQAVFGWTDSHLHNFEKDGKYWGVPEYEDLIDESKVTLAKLLRAGGE